MGRYEVESRWSCGYGVIEGRGNLRSCVIEGRRNLRSCVGDSRECISYGRVVVGGYEVESYGVFGCYVVER